MNYLFICGSISPTYCGIGKYANKTINYLPSDTNIIYLTNDEQSEYNQADQNIIRSYKIIKVNLRKFSLKSLHNVYKTVKENKPEIVNIQHQTFSKNYFDAVFNLAVKIASPKTRTINTIHEFEHFSRLGRVRLMIAGFFSDRILLSDPRQLELYNQFTRNIFKNKTKVTFIGNNVNNQLEEYKIQYQPISPNNEILILGYHGFIQPAKGVYELLEALKNYSVDFKLHILGEFKAILDYEGQDQIIEYQQKCLKLITDNQILKDNIMIHGDIDPSSNKFKEILTQVDLLIFPFQDYLTMRRSSFFATLLASNSLAVSTYKSEISENELEVFEGIGNDSDSILNYLNKFKTLANKEKQQIYNKQLLFKNKMADNQLEQELVRKGLLF